MPRSRLLLFLLIYGLGIFITLNRHAKSGLFNYHSEVWADKAGYFCYLPATFLYQFDARRFPANIDSLTGQGFRLDRATGKVATKYPYGVALLEAPFWLGAHALHPQADGFSVAEQKAVNIAAVTFFTWGLLLLYSTLRRFFEQRPTVFTLLALTFGTNLWHYAFYETGMSHVYSFFAFAWLLWSLTRREPRPWTAPGVPTRQLVGIAAALALISILRPLDLLVALPLLAWPTGAAGGWQVQLRAMLRVRFLAWVVGLLALAWLPQLAYYKYLHGSWLVNSYAGEGFPNWAKPRLAALWFAPNNGSLLYNPLLGLLLLAGCWQLRRYSLRVAGLVAGSWLLLSYVYASWWVYSLGCGYAGRGFVDIYPLLAWPLAAFLTYSAAQKAAWRWGINLLVFALVVYNMELVWHYDRCFFGSHDWDWTAYQHLWQLSL
jgi:hypothetical protein